MFLLFSYFIGLGKDEALLAKVLSFYYKYVAVFFQLKPSRKSLQSIKASLVNLYRQNTARFNVDAHLQVAWLCFLAQ